MNFLVSVLVPTVTSLGFSRDSTMRGVSDGAPQFSSPIRLEPLRLGIIVIITAVFLVAPHYLEAVGYSANAPLSVQFSRILIVGTSVLDSVLPHVLLGEANLTVILGTTRNHESADLIGALTENFSSVDFEMVDRHRVLAATL